MTRRYRQPKPALVQVVVVTAALLLLMAAYVVAMRLALDTSRLGQGDTGNHRDNVYGAIHGGVAVAAAVAGFGLGKWLSGLGFAFMVLFVAAVLVGMVGLTLASHSLACAGHNDLIRHWTC